MSEKIGAGVQDKMAYLRQGQHRLSGPRIRSIFLQFWKLLNRIEQNNLKYFVWQGKDTCLFI